MNSASTAVSTWVIDQTHTIAEFSARHMMVSTVKGRFRSLQGAIQWDEADPSRSSVDATIDVASIDTSEPQRDGHLRSDDFFNAEKYPTISFRSTRIEVEDEQHAKIHGLLTIRDVTKEVVLETELEGRITDPYGKQRAGFSAEAAISRREFDLKWNMLLEGGGAIVGDRVKITLHVEAVLQGETPAQTA